MSLKADMARDIDEVFLNVEDFAAVRHVCNRQVRCVLYAQSGDTNEAGADGMGVCGQLYTLQAKACDLPRVREGDNMVIDGVPWEVVDYRNDQGMAVVKLVRQS